MRVVSRQLLGPFVESYAGVSEEESIERVELLISELKKLGIGNENSKVNDYKGGDDAPTELLAKPTQLTDTLLSEAEIAEMNKTAWGFDSIRAKKNETINTDENGDLIIDLESSASIERRQEKEQKKFLKQLEAEQNKFWSSGEDDDTPTQLVP